MSGIIALDEKRLMVSKKTDCGVDRNNGLINFRLEKNAQITRIINGTIM